jgi:hypothetical protein
MCWRRCCRPAARHPRLELELLVVDRQVDVLKEDVDISVRYRDVLEPGMAVRQLAAVPRVLCASPAYLQPTAGRRRRRTCSTMPACCTGARPMAASCAGRFRATASAWIRSCACRHRQRYRCTWWNGRGRWRHRLDRQLHRPPVHARRAAGAAGPGPGAQGAAAVRGHPLDFFACDRQYVPTKVRALVDYLVETLPQQPMLRWNASA